MPLIPRKARPINTIRHPPSASHAPPSLWLGAAAMVMAAACADLRWHKVGADAATLQQDLAVCQAQARLQAGPDARSFGGDIPRVVGVDAAGRPVMASPGRLDTDRFLAEHDLTRACMRGKGYELVPART